MTSTTTRDFTAELRAAAQAGQTIVCSLEPHEDWPVTDAPRTGLAHDPEPWTIPGVPYRFSGRECHAVTSPGPVIQRIAHRTPGCTCQWVRNLSLKAWDRVTRDLQCSTHGAHDHWSQGCPSDTEGAWVLWLCVPAIYERTITGDH